MGPLTPPECDLRGLPFMPLDVVRLGDSDLAALSTGDEFKAAVLLWCKAWLQVPAASVPDDDRVLAHLTGLGPKWKKVRAMALKGWVKCSDGRLYHPVIAEKAREAWKHRQSQRERVAKRWAAKDENAPDLSQQSSRSGKRSERMAEARRKGTHTSNEWSAMLDICGNRCVKCGVDGRLEKDHIRPVYAGGSDAIGNLQPLCPRCNCAKGPDQRDLRPEDWEEKLHTVLRSELHTVAGNSVGNGRIQGTGTGTGTVVPLPSGNGAEADPDKQFWDSAKAYLGPKKASLIGKWVGQHGREVTAAAIAAAQVERAVDPVEFIQGRFRKQKHDEAAWDGLA